MASFTAKFDEYRDADSPIIYDVDEELAIMREMNEKGVEPKDALSKVELLSQKLKGFNLERKKSATACFLAIYLDLEKKPLQVASAEFSTSASWWTSSAERTASTPSP